ncbi:hypothetical protein Taro_041274 [Colocasia esculenta]|uniref:Retrotransposon gag domain-containing protein n=1 Tax=Colocasia esculenta TaxID=4460 RepID=A0A843WFD5_COLES|nr:hypothetical protein [Colocasia esculenta]
MPTVVTSPVGCSRFFVSQAISSGFSPGTCVVPSRSVSSDLDTLTPVFELYVRLRERRQWDSDTSRLTPTPTGESEEDVSRPSSSSEPRRSGAGCTSGYALGSCTSFQFLWKFGYVTCEIYIKCGVFLCVYTDCGLVSLARLRPVRGRRTRIKYVIGLTGLAEAFRHSWYQKISRMADRRDWGGGGDDPEESTQHMIERIWESLTNIQARMDQQAPVPPVAVPPGDGEAIPVAPVPPRVEVPFVAPVPPPVLLAEEPVMQVEKFLRLQPSTYSGGPNPDTAEHWVHEIERIFATMRCPAADKVVLATYQLRGFALEWWRLKMQTTFAGRTEEAITWSEFLDVFNDTFFLIQVQQVKREKFRTLQQGNSSVLEYQMRFMALSRYAPYVVSDNNMMVEYFIRGLRVELQDAVVPLMCKTVEEAAQRAATLERSIRTCQVGESGSGSFRLPQQSVGASKGKAPARPSSSGFGKWGQKLKQAFKSKGRGWGGRQ